MLGSAKKNIPILEKKMIRGGLADQIETMRRRALSAEYHFIQKAHTIPDRIDAILDQVVNMVKGECDDALLLASEAPEPFGRGMLADVQRRLRELSKRRPEMVEHETYECLMGVAGLLTGECAVWWSKRFNLEEAV
jgi:hypothetical protein